MATTSMWLQVLVISLVVSTTSVTITKTKVFKSLRNYIRSKNYWLGDLIHCPYCTSHYIAILLVAIYQPRVIGEIYLLDYIMSTFVVIALATVWSLLICKSILTMEALGE